MTGSASRNFTAKIGMILQGGDRVEQLFFEKFFFVKFGDRVCTLQLFCEMVQYWCNVVTFLGYPYSEKFIFLQMW